MRHTTETTPFLKDIVDLDADFTGLWFTLFGLSAQPPGRAEDKYCQQA